MKNEIYTAISDQETEINASNYISKKCTLKIRARSRARVRSRA